MTLLADGKVDGVHEVSHVLDQLLAGSGLVYSRDLEYRAGQAGCLGGDLGVDAHCAEGAADDAAGELEELETIRSYPMVGLEVVDLLAEDEVPDVLAQELDHVQRVREAAAVAGEALDEADADFIPQVLQPAMSSRAASSSLSPAAAAAAPPAAAEAAVVLVALVVTDVSGRVVIVAAAAVDDGASIVGAASAMRWTSGTSSMSSRSMQLAEKKVAVGSLKLYGGSGASKDMFAGAVVADRRDIVIAGGEFILYTFNDSSMVSRLYPSAILLPFSLDALHSPTTMAASTGGISAATAAALSVGYTVTFVGVLYLHPLSRPSPTQSRDADSVIRLRVRAVQVSCLLTTLATLVTLRTADVSFPDSLRLMGVWPVSIVDVAKTLALTMVLFAGPLAETLWLEREEGVDFVQDARYALGSWIGWRNYVVVRILLLIPPASRGPWAEEVTFRSHILAVHLCTPNPSLGHLTLTTPLYFGIAHLHHLYEFALTHPDLPLTLAVVRSLVQFCYTTLFGWFAAWVFLHTGSLWAAVAAHSFCNVMGLPRFWGPLEGAGWRTGVYYGLLVLGVVGFYNGLWSWTESDNALISIR
ncbi:LOW QUALITY PROTEIN: hypothetical protein Dda_0928 [Drechslerella dactyloides]|uniref:intramembrane prenyl-peptidase Rce1 n=1 Tax=Drechslerella dactyloides TaxID=74499 RepID=A0AAD6NMH4_DREDA|nr:LOW QUALITY PROTEIN: hypothetical protein Dda_0928 [Drechslerella dactyloides]